jgi:hypothetical protein
MKSIKYILLVVMLLSVLPGCEDYLGDNRDPDAVDVVPPDQIMPVVLFYSALQNYDHSEYGAYLSQNITTAGRSQTGAYAYKSGWEFLGMNRHPQWRRHYYDIGSNANELISLANEENSVNYVAVTRLIRLLSTQMTTDVFGAMPRSEAYKSSSPKYDSQESIYEWMHTEVDDLIELFNSEEVSQPTNRNMDFSVDRIFGGDMERWKQVAYALKARILLRQIPNITQEAVVAQEILDAAETALSGWYDPAYNFDGGSSVEKNCMWGRTSSPINGWESRANNLDGAIPSKFFLEEVMAYDAETDTSPDPRLPFLMEKRGEASVDQVDDWRKQYEAPENPEDAIDYATFKTRIDGVEEWTYMSLESNSGMPATHKIEWYPNLYDNVLTTDTSSIILITKGELHFIASEAAFWAGQKALAVTHMKAGIEYHMNRMGVPADRIEAYLNNPNAVPGDANITLSHIMMEKYKALFLQPELWNDMRRYGYSNDLNNRRFNNTVIYPGLRRPHNLYDAYWSQEGEWIQRLNYDPETEEKYNREELIRLDAFRNPDWLKKPMIWAPQN